MLKFNYLIKKPFKCFAIILVLLMQTGCRNGENISEENALIENQLPKHYGSNKLNQIESKNDEQKIILNTICLNHLFLKYKLLLKKVDYISIDTEGTEFEILKNFNFKRFNVRIFSIEHNFEKKKRNKIFKLMSKNGYTRVYKFFSYMDDWYIKYNGNEII